MFGNRKRIKELEEFVNAKINILSREVSLLKESALKSKYIEKKCTYAYKNQIMDFKIADVKIFNDQIYLIDNDVKGNWHFVLHALETNDWNPETITGFVNINNAIIE